ARRGGTCLRGRARARAYARGGRLSPSPHLLTDSRWPTAMAPSISPLFDLTGRTALVTGGAKGLGLAMARGLAEHGAPIVLADIDDETGRAAAEERAAATGVAVSYRHLDVTDQALVEKVVAEIDDEVGGIEILLNNAGRTIHHPLEDGDGEKWHAVMRLNLDGVYHVLSAVGRR